MRSPTRSPLARLGATAAAHPWRMLAGWLLILVATVGLAGVIGGETHDNYTVSGAPSQAGADLLAERFPELSGAGARVVVHDRTGNRIDPGVLAEVRSRVERLPDVGDVSEARPSADGDTALISVRYLKPVTDLKGVETIDELRAAAQPARDAGLQVELGGQVVENIQAPSGVAEAIGIVAALIIMVLALGSVVAAGLPLVVALFGLGVGMSVITLMAAVTDISVTAPTVATMVGLGVGIDYALLLVSRFTEGLRRGLSTVDAAAEANATAGASVLVAGSTVLVSLFGMAFAGLPTYTSFGYATFAIVSLVMISAVTLVPALCGLAGRRMLPRKVRRAAAKTTLDAGTAQTTLDAGDAHTTLDARPTRTERWARAVAARPWPVAIAGLVFLLALAAPVLVMRTWPQDASSQPTSNTARVAYDLIADEYGAGANGPLVVAIDLDKVAPDTLPALAERLRATPGVAAVTPPVTNAAGDTAVIFVEPTTGPQDTRTTDLLTTLRAEVLPGGAELTGLVAVFADIVDRLSDRLWVVVAFVVSMSLLLLTVLFRAPVVALKAAAMNLLSVAAAYGVMTAVFQWGWGAELLGLPHAVPVSSFVPILMFAVLFGLSMDYEVFLLSRVRELWLATGDAHGSVVRGLAATGRVITSAAAIMVAVFIGFALDPDITVKMVGVGMAVAVLIDATVVRMLLVPAVMALLGRGNWWIPRWLDRILPTVNVEGGRRPRAAEPAPVPAATTATAGTADREPASPVPSRG
ncbi:RND transporter [Virgisporangium aurantiacum]|uniref:RND transporter n=1 Tax=Virgisporangium aurantiacum TaxID=175570 RepID=A0A8J3Z117_9ACTN|nr:RND transporter [Virgisporangium aurantiacum]